MMVRQLAGALVQIDAEGYLASRAEWTPEMADVLAGERGITLTPQHWKVITFCREDAANNQGLSPGLRRIAQLSGVGIRELHGLYPRDAAKLAARIAGLPKPRSSV